MNKGLGLIVALTLSACSASYNGYNGHKDIEEYNDGLKVRTLSGQYIMSKDTFENLRSIAAIKDGIKRSEQDQTADELMIEGYMMIETFTPCKNPQLWDEIIKTADNDNDHNITNMEFTKYYNRIMREQF